MGLESEINQASNLGKKVEELESELIFTKSILYDHLGGIIKRIKNGESTGDDIKDFVISIYRTVSGAEYEEPYRQLRESLKKHKGDEIMIVEFSRENSTSQYTFGILTEDLKFDAKTESLIFPTKTQLSSNNFSLNNSCKWTKEEGPIKRLYHPNFTPDCLEGIIKTCTGTDVYSDAQGASIYLGQDIVRYFTSNNWSPCYGRALELLGAVKKK